MKGYKEDLRQGDPREQKGTRHKTLHSLKMRQNHQNRPHDPTAAQLNCNRHSSDAHLWRKWTPHELWNAPNRKPENEFKTLKCSMWLSCVQMGTNVPSSFILHHPSSRAPHDMSAKVGSLQVTKVSRYRRIGLTEIPRLQMEKKIWAQNVKRPKAIIESCQLHDSIPIRPNMKIHKVILRIDVNQGSHWASFATQTDQISDTLSARVAGRAAIFS